MTIQHTFGFLFALFGAIACEHETKVQHASSTTWEPIALAEAVISSELGPERVVVLFNVRIGDRRCRAQFDTGANSQVIWHSDTKAVANQKEKVIVEALGVKRALPASALQQKEIAICNKSNPILTIGNAFFEHGTIALDLRRALARFQNGSTLKNGEPFIYHRQNIGGHTLIKARLPNDKEERVVLFDTGAARFGFVFAKRAEFEKATAHLAETAKRRYSVSAWGKQISCVETKDEVLVSWGESAEKPMRLSHCAQEFLEDSGLSGLICKSYDLI